jgi:hypothetical protein
MVLLNQACVVFMMCASTAVLAAFHTKLWYADHKHRTADFSQLLPTVYTYTPNHHPCC